MHWQRLIDRNTSELLKYNQTAVKYINGEVPQIFASGYNKVAEQIPDSPVAGFDFELINADTVNNLVHEDGIILPPKKKVDPEKDKAWNAKLINAQLLQGIMQGESIPEMAKRMQTVANSDLAGATRTARTMHTAAQNAGRQSGYNKAAKQGIIFEKTWISARQINRTRDTHYALHGTTVPYNEKFVTIADNELEFPGDWRAPAEEVYNCRCTMITKFKGFVSGLTIKEIQGMRDNYRNMAETEQDNCIQRVGQYMVGRMKQTIKNALPQIDSEVKRLEKLSDDIQAKLDALEAEGKSMSKEWWSFANDADDLDRVLKKARESRAFKLEAEMRKLIEEVRNCGYSKAESNFLLENKKSDDDKAAKKVIAECVVNYPRDWLKASCEYGKIDVGVANRGGYSPSKHFIHLSGAAMDYKSHPVAYHEFGHRIEQVVPEVAEAEGRFYSRRTQGEALVKLKDITNLHFEDYEVTRVDKFLDPYMGKDYGDGTYELVSMGFERYFTSPEELVKDEDYARFITGVLALV